MTLHNFNTHRNVNYTVAHGNTAKKVIIFAYVLIIEMLYIGDFYNQAKVHKITFLFTSCIIVLVLKVTKTLFACASWASFMQL